jgi:hypothetical protein
MLRTITPAAGDALSMPALCSLPVTYSSSSFTTTMAAAEITPFIRARRPTRSSVRARNGLIDWLGDRDGQGVIVIKITLRRPYLETPGLRRAAAPSSMM